MEVTYFLKRVAKLQDLQKELTTKLASAKGVTEKEGLEKKLTAVKRSL